MIEYRTPQSSRVNDNYSTIIREASEFFAKQKIQMVGNGFEEIIAEQVLFDEYVTKLCEGLDATEAAEVAQLMENGRTQILSEASISGIQPVASLSMPTMRKMWVKIALKNALPTEPVKTPKFVISFMEPYLKDASGNKIALPDALRNPANNYAEKRKLSTTPINIPADNKDLMADVSGTIVAGDSIDPKFFVTKVNMSVKDSGGANAETKAVVIKAALDVRDNLYVEVQAAHTDTTVTKDVLFGHLDRATGIFNAQSLKGTITSVVVDGYLSSENNTKQQSVSFDMKTKDVTIGTGAHINAPLPIEFLQDVMALYNIDGAVEAVDLMSNVVAQKLEQEIDQFIGASYDMTAAYTGSFDVHPSTAFAGNPKDWREEIKTVIDFWALKMKNDTAFTNGKFVIMGNPLDVQLIPNVNWVFTSVTDERGGVEVDFSLGAYSGANRYELVSTPNIAQGVLKMIFLPSTPRQMTYKYYPYTFNVEKGYIDPQHPNVPSIMMTKRHTIEELTPLVCEITILNNNGVIGYQS